MGTGSAESLVGRSQPPSPRARAPRPRGYRHALAALAIVVVVGGARAADPAPSASGEVEVGAVDSAASASGSAAISPPPPEWKPGPQSVTLGHDLTLDVPAEDVFVAMPLAAKMLESTGNFHNEDLLGIVLPKEEAPDDESWFVVIRYQDAGYVTDDEKIDGKELLEVLRESQKEANEERKTRGFAPLQLDGWQEEPRYDRADHHLVWGLVVSDPEGRSLNYNTRMLGRRGFVSLNLVVDPKDFARYRPEVTRLLNATSFGSGARYEDYVRGTDKVAEYGLTGLVLGGAGVGAAKLAKAGILAKLGVFLVKGWKVVALAIFAALAGARRWFTGKEEDDTR